MNTAKIAAVILLSVIFSACGSLKSVTYIKPNDAFILGNNQHGSFTVKMKNTSANNLEVWRTPVDGGQHSPVTVKPNETVKINVEKNTALRIYNNTNAQASVHLNVKGDVGLSMGYKN